MKRGLCPQRGVVRPTRPLGYALDCIENVSDSVLKTREVLVRNILYKKIHKMNAEK